MAILVLRTVKGSPLTNLEVDNNFSNLLIDIGVISNLTTTAKSNLVAAINELQTGVSILSVARIANANSIVSIPVANGPIYANVNTINAVTITQDFGSNANIRLSGRVIDNNGNVLRILDESNNVIWGL